MQNIDPRDTEEVVEGLEPPEAGGWIDYPIDALKIRDERRSVIDVVRRINKNNFILDPDFQREFLWSTQKQSRLIESIILRIPLPVFYVAENDAGELIVVDGRQRLTTLREYFSGELVLDLPDQKDLHKKRFQNLETRLQNRIEDCQLHFYIIDHTVPERARLDIFERVNGGEQLTRQQMRNAIYSGPAARFLKDQACSEAFQAATGSSLNVKSMQDREFVNRFCAFALLPIEEYKSDMDAWLGAGLKALAAKSDQDRAILGARLQTGLKNSFQLFGRHSFRKHLPDATARGILNASLFDVMMSTLADKDPDVVIERAAIIRRAFFELLKCEVFNTAITFSPNTAKQVRTRFRLASESMAGAFYVD